LNANLPAPKVAKDRETEIADIRRSGNAAWLGSLPKGAGTVGTESGVLKNQRYTFYYENEKREQDQCQS
jgi:hypothetical protein